MKTLVVIWMLLVAAIVVGGTIRTSVSAPDDSYTQMDWEWDCEWENETDPDYEEAFDDYDNDDSYWWDDYAYGD